MLFGNRIYLRLMEEKDIPYKVRWINDPQVRETLNFDYPISEIGTKQWLLKTVLDTNRKDFIVCLKENDVPIGYAGFLNIDLKNRKAEIYLGIGEKKHWGKGMAQEITSVQLKYSLKELGLKKIYAFTWTGNEKMIHVYKKLGFKIEGTLRQDVFSHGEHRDRVIMGILRDEYKRIKPD